MQKIQNKVINVNWHINDKSHVGKSTCGKYCIIINDDNGHFNYSIAENGKVAHTSPKPHQDINEAKNISLSLLSLKTVFFNGFY